MSKICLDDDELDKIVQRAVERFIREYKRFWLKMVVLFMSAMIVMYSVKYFVLHLAA